VPSYSGKQFTASGHLKYQDVSVIPDLQIFRRELAENLNGKSATSAARPLSHDDLQIGARCRSL
jgi:hypothetical protein